MRKIRVALGTKEKEMVLLLKRYGFTCIGTKEHSLYIRLWLESKMYSYHELPTSQTFLVQPEELETILFLDELDPNVAYDYVEELSNEVPSIQK